MMVLVIPKKKVLFAGCHDYGLDATPTGILDCGSQAILTGISTSLLRMPPKGSKKVATTKKGLNPTDCVCRERHPEGLTLRLRQELADPCAA